MLESHSKRDSTTARQKVLEAAAEIIADTGRKNIAVSDLAARAKTSRATIHSLFKAEDESRTATVIYLEIVNVFMQGAQKFIQLYLTALDPASTPIDRLAAVFRATLATFAEMPKFGKVVLQQLNLSNEEERIFAEDIFARVDQIVAEARRKGEIPNLKQIRSGSEARELGGRLDDWMIRQVLFVVTRGLLRTIYFDEGRPKGKDKFREKDVEVEVLRILQLYCSKPASAKIQKTINAIIGDNNAGSED